MMQQDSSYQNNNWLLYIRSMLFLFGMTTSTVVIAPIMIMAFPLPFDTRYSIAQIWVKFNLWFLKSVCHLDHAIQGLDNIPEENGIIFCKHQSAWETIALQAIFPTQVFILKRELLWLPFFGWAMATCDPIAIDRKAGKAALRQVVEQGIERLKNKRWVVIFPEGTRVAPGEKRKYGAGGGILAHKANAVVIPVAHNAGKYWGKYSFLKFPGTIQVRIGQPIYPDNLKAQQINEKAKNWIERQMSEIS